MLVFPPLGLLVGFAGVIRDNWEGIKEFFSTLWQTVKLAFQVAFEGIQFLALSALAGIRDAWSSITGFFGELWSGIHGFFIDTPLAPIFEWMVDRVKAVVSPLLDFFGNFWDNVSDMAGKALGWITDLLGSVNEFLGRWSDDLRQENEKLRSELNLSSHVQEDVLVDVKPSVQVEKPMIESPSLEAEKPVIEPLKAQIQHPTASVIEKPGVPSTSELNAIIQSADAEKPASTAPIVPPSEVRTHLSTPMSSESPQVSIPLSDLVKVELGVLAEVRKQTLLLEGFKQMEMGVDTVSATPILTEMQTPVIDAPLAQIAEAPIVEMPRIVMDTPAVEMPELFIDDPSIEMGGLHDASFGRDRTVYTDSGGFGRIRFSSGSSHGKLQFHN